ncbi:MAG: response regulator [Candidatus Aminicenantes bacterium]|nr:response regulator [Candidatus Aminicenantes bacterium]
MKKDRDTREFEAAVRRVERHRAMLADLVSAQQKALSELRELGGKAGGVEVDDEIRRTALCRSLLSGEAGGQRRATPKVLLVDDDPTTRNLISHFLRKENFIVDKAAGGTEGLAKARSGKPDLLVLDVVVPGMNGFELLSLLKKDPETASIPVLILSSLDEEEAIVKGLEEGADYITKPFSPRVLVAKIKKILKDAGDHAAHHRPL